MINGLLMIKLKRSTKKLYNRIILKRKELKINKKKMINIQNIKEWITHRYWLIKRRLNLKQFKKFKWVSISLKLGIILPIRPTITMANAFTYVNSAWHFLIYPNSWRNIHKNVLFIIHQAMKFIEMNRKKWPYSK